MEFALESESSKLRNAGLMYKHATEASWYARHGNPSAVTFVDAIVGLTRTDRGFTFLDRENNERFYSFAQLKEEAIKRAAALRIQPGEKVALVLPDPADFVLTFMGVVYAGGVAVPMYPPLSLGKLDQYLESAARILNAAEATLLVTSKQVETVLWPVMPQAPLLRDIVTVETLASRDEASQAPAHVSLDDLVFLQFTSGSTSEPKGVRVTHRALFENSKAITAAMNADEATDHGVSWLPLYHDMGLIGFVLLPILWGLQVTFIPTMSFIRRPSLWFETITRKRGTITFAPNFAYSLMTKRAASGKFDLSSLRIAGCGAEPVQAETMAKFAETFAPMGFRSEALLPCYGMAEATLAITFNPVLTPIKVDHIDKQRYREKHEATPGTGMQVVSCGFPFVDHEVGIVDDHGARLPDRQVGEVIVRGPSVTDGYHQRPEATAAAYKNGWLYTGDLGYMADGELYICGRKKDLIIVKGRNYHPQSIEWAVERVNNVRKGNVVAFSVADDSSEALVIAAETGLKQGRAELQTQIKEHVVEQFGLSAKDVVLVGPGQLPKTSSGKLQRQRARTLYMSGSLQSQGNRTVGAGAGSRLGLAVHVMKSMGAKLRHRIANLGSQA